MTDRQSFLDRRPVSRETAERFDTFAAVLTKWSAAINLIAPSTLPMLWTRHILDSAQLFDAFPARVGRWADMGSGAGFPGLVVAILASEEAPALEIHLIESDRRKAAFLAEAARACDVRVTVHAARAETLPPLDANVVSARAVAPLTRLLALAQRHLAPGGIAVFPKGATSSTELNDALANWRFAYDKRPSVTEADSVVLLVSEIEHA